MAVTTTLDELGGWPFVLGRLTGGESLTSTEAAAAMAEILDGSASPALISAFIVALRMKGETVEEMTGLLEAMLGYAERVPVDDDLHLRLVDTCGTGGDRSHTINVSTMAALVVAAAGAPVCKHGNRAASSASGSADVLEALGVVIDLGPEGVARCIAEAGIGFCFAPRFHPAMRHAGPTRRELGVPTVFNFLGPMANPARVRRQVLGVSDPGMAEKMVAVLEAGGTERALVVYGHDGLDELTTTTTSTVIELRDGALRTYVVDPRELGVDVVEKEALRGGEAAVNAELVHRVFSGEDGPHRDVVALNAAAGLVVGGVSEDLVDGLALARAVIDDGRAAATLEALVSVSKSAAADQPQQ